MQDQQQQQQPTTLTLEQAKTLQSGDTLYIVDVTILRTYTYRIRVTSVKTWKREPERIRIRAKYGLRMHVQFNEHELHRLRTEQQLQQLQEKQAAADRAELASGLAYLLGTSNAILLTPDGRLHKTLASSYRYILRHRLDVARVQIDVRNVYTNRSTMEARPVMRLTFGDGRVLLASWGDLRLAIQRAHTTLGGYELTQAAQTVWNEQYAPSGHKLP